MRIRVLRLVLVLMATLPVAACAGTSPAATPTTPTVAETFAVVSRLCDKVDVSGLTVIRPGETTRVSIDSTQHGNPEPGYSACFVIPLDVTRFSLLPTATLEQSRAIQKSVDLEVLVYPTSSAAQDQYRQQVAARSDPNTTVRPEEGGPLTEQSRTMGQYSGVPAATQFGVLGWRGNAFFDFSYRLYESCGDVCLPGNKPQMVAVSADTMDTLLRDVLTQTIAAMRA
jgi:hypothetical protein